MDGGNAAHKTSAALNVLGVLASFSLGFRVGLFVRSVDVDDDDEYERDDEEGSLHLEEVRSGSGKQRWGENQVSLSVLQVLAAALNGTIGHLPYRAI